MKKGNSSDKSRDTSKVEKVESAKKTIAKKATAKKVSAKKTAAKKSPSKKSAKPARKVPTIPKTGSLEVRMAAAKKIEAIDRPKAEKVASQEAPQPAPTTAAALPPQRNSDFPNTYISQISVRLEDPDHPVTLLWTGPNSAAQETGPFRASPGAGLRGLNCDLPTTSLRSGSTCTPKGTFTVTGFASQLSSHPEAKDVTWFVPARGIALHYYPSVPNYAASHGCVRLELRRVAQLIKNNSRAGITQVVVDGTWTKPPHQW